MLSVDMLRCFFYCSSFPAEILNTARRDGNTLIVVDTAGRVLELSQLLVSTKDIHDCITNVIVEHIIMYQLVDSLWHLGEGKWWGGGGGGGGVQIPKFFLKKMFWCQDLRKCSALF